MAQGRKMKRGRKYNFIYHIDHISFDFSFTVILKPFYIIINNSWWLQMLNVFEHEHANHSNWVENANNRFIIDIFFHFGFAFCELIKRNTHIVVYSLLLQFSSSLIFFRSLVSVRIYPIDFSSHTESVSIINYVTFQMKMHVYACYVAWISVNLLNCIEHSMSCS